MPLSEHEQRALEQIERALYADDPKFAATVRGIDPRTLHRRRYLRAIVGLVVGIVLLPVGIAIQQSEVSIAGFVLMLIAFLYGATTWRRTREVPDGAAPPDLTVAPRRRAGVARASSRPPAVKRGFMQRFEDRWDHRRDGLGHSGSDDRPD